MGEAVALAEASVAELTALIRKREISSVQITEACLARIDVLNATYRPYLTVFRDQAMQAARKADADVRKQEDLGLLHGIPVSVKDVFLIRGTPTTLGSTLLQGYSADDRADATCVERLRQAGAIILGKVHVGSGMAANPDNTHLDPPRNPWRSDCTPGGSSSGSAVSVALGMGYASVGTDLGGSIRIPAAFTGVVGLKPTYGRVSQYGNIYGLCRSLDHVGPLTRTVRDAALMLEVLAGHDPRDPTSERRPVPDFLSFLNEGFQNEALRIGWASDGGPLGAEPEVLSRVETGVRLLANAGGLIEEIGLPPFDGELWSQLVLLEEWELSEAGSSPSTPYLAYIRGRLRDGRRKLLDQMTSQVARVRESYGKLFEQFDLLVLPTTPITAKPFKDRKVWWMGRQRDFLDLYISNTWVFNVTGHPAISLPCGFGSEGLPVGLQIVARQFEEGMLLRAAAMFEQAAGGFPMPQVL